MKKQAIGEAAGRSRARSPVRAYRPEPSEPLRIRTRRRARQPALGPSRPGRWIRVRRGWARGMISLFVLWHLFALAIWLLPHLSPAAALRARGALLPRLHGLRARLGHVRTQSGSHGHLRRREYPVPRRPGPHLGLSPHGRARVLTAVPARAVPEADRERLPRQKPGPLALPRSLCSPSQLHRSEQSAHLRGARAPFPLCPAAGQAAVAVPVVHLLPA
jgi:hypothetical protein